MCILYRNDEKGRMMEVITSVFNKIIFKRRKKKAHLLSCPQISRRIRNPSPGNAFLHAVWLGLLLQLRVFVLFLYLFSISVFFFSSLALLCTHIARKTWANHIAAPPLHTHDTSRGARSATVSHIDCSSAVRSERVQKVYFDHLAREL